MNGKKVKCPKCGSVARVAAVQAAPALPTTAQESPFAFDAASERVAPERDPPTSTAGQRIKLTPGKLGCLAVVVILFLIGLIVQLINPDFGQDTPEAAWVVTQSFVEKRLRSPTSASFPWYDKSFVQQLPDEGGKKRYRVSAYVDAQNAFGAKIRTRFTCTVRYIGGKDLVWHLENLDFESP